MNQDLADFLGFSEFIYHKIKTITKIYLMMC